MCRELQTPNNSFVLHVFSEGGRKCNKMLNFQLKSLPMESDFPREKHISSESNVLCIPVRKPLQTLAIVEVSGRGGCHGIPKSDFRGQRFMQKWMFGGKLHFSIPGAPKPSIFLRFYKHPPPVGGSAPPKWFSLENSFSWKVVFLGKQFSRKMVEIILK